MPFWFIDYNTCRLIQLRSSKGLMIFRYLMIFSIACSVGLFGSDRMLMKQLKSRYVRTIRSSNVEVASVVSGSFNAVIKHDKNEKFTELINNPAIQGLFSRSIYQQDQQFIEKTQTAQQIILLGMYLILYQQYIQSAKCFLNNLLLSKKYWFYEKFYLSQASLKKHPIYLLYPSSYKRSVETRLQGLEDLEEQIAHMLGVCLYGSYILSSLKNEDQIKELLLEASRPLYEVYHLPSSGFETVLDPIQLFTELGYIYGNMDEHMTHVKDVLEENKKPNFFVEHWFGCSCSAVALVAAYGLYVKHQKEIPVVANKTIKVIDDFIDEYIVQSIDGLVKVVWHGNKGVIPRLPEIPPLAHVDRLPIKALGQRIEGYTTSFQNNLNVKLDEINTREKAWTTYSNKLLDVIEDTFVKNQQVNMYLAAIGPVLLGTYFVYKSGSKAYGRFVEHDGWYAPMKYQLRAIDQLINSVAHKDIEHSFANDGKLYMLVMHLSQYITCLQDEELMLMRQDLKELLSFELNYDQKQGVLERIYRTYQFLK